MMARWKALLPLALWAAAVCPSAGSRRPTQGQAPLASGAVFLSERSRPVLGEPRYNTSKSGKEYLTNVAALRADDPHHGEHAEEAHGSGEEPANEKGAVGHGHAKESGSEEGSHGHAKDANDEKGGAHAEDAHGGHGHEEEHGHAAAAHMEEAEEAHAEHGHAKEHGHGAAHAEKARAAEHDHGGAHAEEAHGGHGHAEEHGHEREHGHGGAHAEEAHGGHGHEHGHEEGHSHGHGPSGEGAHSVAVGLIATVVIVPIVMFMAMSDWLIATLTFKMLDTFISIFLAVLWFNTFAQFLETFDIKDAFPLAREFFSLMQCLVLYGIALTIAYLWRNEHLTMATFCSVGAHFIAFSGILAASQTQKSVSKLPPKDWEPAASFAFCFFVMALIAGISAITWFSWRRNVKHEEMNHAVEHLELDIVGLVVSFAITQAVRHAIMGRYPPTGHLLLQEAVFGHHGPVHNDWQIWFMFGWAVALTCIAGLSLPTLSSMAESGPWAARGVHVMKVILIMLVAWGFLLWGEWAFYERMFEGDMMFGHMVFSCLATLVCLLVLYCMASLQGHLTSSQAKETQNITITGISLVAAWSWEHCFNIAFDVIGEEYQVGLKGLVPKLVLAIVIPAVLLPTYVRHIRTRVMEIEKHEHAHGHGHGEEHGHAEHGEGHQDSAEASQAQAAH